MSLQELGSLLFHHQNEHQFHFDRTFCKKVIPAQNRLCRIHKGEIQFNPQSGEKPSSLRRVR